MSEEREKADEKKSKSILYVIIAILAFANLAFKSLNEIELEQTSLLFVGIPALIAILVIKYAKPAEGAYGIVFRIITIFLLLSSVLLGEGLICIIIMSPLFYVTGAICVQIYKMFKKRNKSNLHSFVLLPVLLVVAQVHEINQTPEVNRIERTVVLEGHKTLDDMNVNPDFLHELPDFFKIGFPKPISNSGQGLEVGDTRSIQFKSNTKGVGDLVFEITSKTNQSIHFKPVEDHTHIHHWLSWKDVNVEITHHENNTSTITWTTDYTCDLGPSWYFKPIENYAVGLMNTHLINSYFNAPRNNK